MLGRRVRKCRVFFFRMCLSLYDYQSKASRYTKGLTFLKNRVTTNQKHAIGSQKPKKNTNIIQKVSIKVQKKKQKQRNTKSTGKQGLKWQ